MAEAAYAAFEAIPGALDSGALIICDHASNAIPPGYGTLGLPREALDRHIAYDIGAADVTRALARRARRAGRAVDLFPSGHRSKSGPG